MKGRYLFILLVFCTYPLFADSFRHINIKNGLSSRRVFQIKQDSTGFMWFFTYTGVDRYDGSEIKHYTLSENLEAEDNILSSTNMVCDMNNNIWIAMKNGKIYCYDKEKDNFTLRVNVKDFLPGEESGTLNNMMFDNEGKLWLCLSSGLYNFNLNNNKLVLISDFNNEQVTAIAQAEEQLFCVGTYQHVYYIRKENNTEFSITKQELSLNVKTRVESLHFHNNKLYIGTFSSGAYIVDLDKNQIISLSHIIPHVPIRVISSTHDDRILIGTDGAGFYSIHTSTNQLVKKYLADEDISTSMKGNTVCDIFVDGENRIWIGTSTNGISILDSRYPDIKITKHEYRNSNSLINDHVNVIMEDSDGDLWYGTNNGVSMYSIRNNQWTHYLNDKREVKSSPVVLALCEDGQNNIWAGGFGIGAFCINKHTNKVSELKIRKNNEPAGLATSYIFSIYADDNEVWFGGIEGEFTQYNIRTEEYRYFPIECIGDIKAGNENNLLLATCDGLGIFDLQNGNTEWFSEFNGTTLNSPIRCLFPTSKGVVWLASDGEGVIFLDRKNGSSEFLTLNDGTASNSILSILPDNTGRIWFSSERGLYCVNPETKVITNMDEYIGIENNNYNPNACFKRKNGDLIFGTADGAIEFSPNRILNEKDSVKLIFTDFKLFYKSIKIDDPESPLKTAINETSHIFLKYTQNSFSFSVSSINFRQPNFIQYLCKLDGFEKAWHPVPKDNNVGYTNIGSGKYEFKVRAINRYTKNIIDERNMEIYVGKPFWASDWAFMIYLGLIVVILLFILQYSRVKIEKQNSKEKISFFINMAHDIRTPITLIKAPLSDLEESETLSEKGKESLAIAIKNTEKFISMVNQLLDFQKADLSTERLILSKNELFSYMDEKIKGFEILASKKSINLEMKTAIKEPEVYFDRNKMDKIINNLLSNAINYTMNGGTVTVLLKSDKDNWSAEIKDTGIGIPANEQKNLFKSFYRAENAINSKETGTGIGLLLTKRLVEMHHGNIRFSSVENEGSTFELTFPTGNNNIAHTPADKEKNRVKEKLQPVPTKSVKEKLLLVEDNDDMRNYLNNSLSNEYQVFTVNDGQQAIEQISAINPDIIISDVLMPKLSGEEMCKLLKSSVETSHIPILLLTALNGKEHIIKGLDSGADDYVTKPFDPSVLKARIRSLLQNREKLRKALLTEDIAVENVNYSNLLDQKFMNKAVSLIEKEMSNTDFTINDYCQSLGMSRSSVYSKIKTLTGHGPSEFIRLIRLNKARKLLRTKKYNISEVAIMVGFSDAKYFSTSFKKQFGISPRKFASEN